jgi:hypothetical protein
MGLVFGTFRKLRFLAKINDMPLARVYWYMRRNSIVYALYTTLYLIIGIANMVQASYKHSIGVLYLISAGVAALAGGANLYCYTERSQFSSGVAATLSFLFSVWTIGKLIILASFLSGIDDVILAVYIIIGLLIILSGTTSVYIHYVIIKRLRAGERPDAVEGPGGGGGLRDDLIPVAEARSDTNVPPPVQATAVPVANKV